MDIREISKKAEEIAQKYNPDGYSPFPFDKIEEDNIDLKLFFSDKLETNVSGAIFFDENSKSFIIMVNKNKPITRMHFTIAHELGHYFLHKDIIKSSQIIIDGDNSLDGQNILYRDDDIKDRSILETEANNFAASLIMPEYLVKKAWDKLRDIEACAKAFNVSVVAMSIRLERLKILT